MEVKGTLLILSPETDFFFFNWDKDPREGGSGDIGHQPMRDNEPWEERIDKLSPTTYLTDCWEGI